MQAAEAPAGHAPPRRRARKTHAHVPGLRRHVHCERGQQIRLPGRRRLNLQVPERRHAATQTRAPRGSTHRAVLVRLGVGAHRLRRFDKATSVQEGGNDGQ